MASAAFIANGGRFLCSKFGLLESEVEQMLKNKNCDQLILDHEDWREQHGCSASSPMSRGKLLASFGIK